METINLSKRDKELEAIRNNPKNIKFETLQKILISKGFSETVPGGGSSHYTYHKNIYRITVVRNKPVNQIYVKQVIRIIDEITKEDQK